MLEQILIIIGASIFGLLGSVHLIYTFFSHKFNARDQHVTAAMKSTSPMLTHETTIWNAWIGFNASHSLGAILMAAVFVPLALFYMPIIKASLWFSVLPLMVALCYLVLAKLYWFKIPLIGISLATVCFAVAFIIIFFTNI